MMNIVTGGGGEEQDVYYIDFVIDYFTFNFIPYTQIDLWDNDIDMGRHTMNNSLLEKSNTLLVINGDIFLSLCDWDYSRQQLIKFCKKMNSLSIFLRNPLIYIRIVLRSYIYMLLRS